MSDTRATLLRWESLFRDLRCGRADPADYERLMTAWGDPARRHHSISHLEACLAEFDTVRAAAQRPAEVELALWFHDAVFAPRAGDNEAKSAAWARRVLRAAVVPDAVGARVEAYILATRDAPPDLEGDAGLVVDVDLAVLGSDAAAYEAYAQAVRAEVRWLPGFLYRRGRRLMLERLLARPRIYSTDAFRAKYEAAARRNLEQERGAIAGRRSAA